MASDGKFSKHRDSAPNPNMRGTQEAKHNRGLSLDEVPRKAASEERSPDPYNTSGSFDRTKNWSRVGKR
jgi:hypothetical protein